MKSIAGVEIVPFAANMLDEASILLAKQHQKNRKSAPLLPIAYEEPAKAALVLETVWKSAGSMGAAAFHKQKMIGFLIGNVAINSIRGRHAWIHPAGAVLDTEADPELFRDLYAVVGEIWVKNGIFDHYALLPGNGHTHFDPWLQAGFSYEQTHALMDLEHIKPDVYRQNPKLSIRRAQPEDREILRSFSTLIALAHAGRPVWGVALPEDLPELRDGYAEILDDSSFHTWIAFLGDTPVGMQAYRELREEQPSLLLPARTIRLTVGSTIEEARGRGVSTTLLAAGLQFAIGQGYRYCETDWRATHLLSSRYWPKQGFQPVAHRLVRKVDPRIVWANGYNELDLKAALTD
ncbi:GNAT family N-acetyltransferase [Brevibacillus migulae]|uniref:GNAT family N-acetyltransferase n=1 Tax=Brevibacillus migulae TaxID=1644114 RepID=UPI00106E30DA|nr:GNAT family N-acetyltransferase [Brevibacillus migulae]